MRTGGAGEGQGVAQEIVVIKEIDIEPLIERIQAFYAAHGWIGTTVLGSPADLGTIFHFSAPPWERPLAELCKRLNEMGCYRVMALASPAESAAWLALYDDREEQPIWKCEVLAD